jgi:hypothetical protein
LEGFRGVAPGVTGVSSEKGRSASVSLLEKAFRRCRLRKKTTKKATSRRLRNKVRRMIFIGGG